MTAPDTRRIATRAEIASSLEDDEYGDWFADQFALWDNPRFAEIRWSTLTELDGSITPPQMTLLALTTMINQTANGGLQQCFFNYQEDAQLLRREVETFGWPELSERFAQKYNLAFEAPNAKGLLQTLRAAEWEGADVGDPDAKPFSHFAKIYDVFDFEDFDQWLLVDGYSEFVARLKAFISSNTAELFDIQDA